MKKLDTLAGKIINLKASDTRFGRRAEAKIETMDHSTGEITETIAIAWKDDAIDIETQGLGKDIGLSGSWSKPDQHNNQKFQVKRVSNLRIIDPRTFDASAYL